VTEVILVLAQLIADKQTHEDIRRAETYRTSLKAEITTLEDRREQCKLEWRNLERKRAAVQENTLRETKKILTAAPKKTEQASVSSQQNND